MKKSNKSIVTAVLALTLTGALLSGCGAVKDKKAANAAESGDSDEVQVIHVGTGNGYEPYCYLDEDGKGVGYEYEVLYAVDELLPQYEFEFEQYDFKNILLSIDSGKVDIGAHQFEQNPDRLANYTFGEVPYTTFIRYIVVDANRDDISSLDDLAGKHVYASPGDNATWLFEKYNEENPDNKIILDVVEGLTSEETVAGLTSGKWDAYSATKRDIEDINAAFGTDGKDVLKIVDEPILNSNTYFVFKKGNTQLQSEVDEALKTLKSNGKLSEISIEVIGGDFTEEE
jgi:L-cystine transport system substrate-binding protein